jgi:hypothetical protein
MSNSEKEFFKGMRKLISPDTSQPPPNVTDLLSVADNYHDHFSSDKTIMEEPLTELWSDDSDGEGTPQKMDPLETLAEFVEMSVLFFGECRIRGRMTRSEQLEFLQLVTNSSSCVDFTDLSSIINKMLYLSKLATTFSAFTLPAKTDISLQVLVDSHMQSSLYPDLGKYPFVKLKVTQLRVHTFLWSYLMSCTAPELFRFDFDTAEHKKDLFKVTAYRNPIVTGILIGLRHSCLPDVPQFSTNGVHELFCHNPPHPLGIETRDWSVV